MIFLLIRRISLERIDEDMPLDFSKWYDSLHDVNSTSVGYDVTINLHKFAYKAKCFKTLRGNALVEQNTELMSSRNVRVEFMACGVSILRFCT